MAPTCVLGAYGVVLEKSIFGDFWAQWIPIGNAENQKFRILGLGFGQFFEGFGSSFGQNRTQGTQFGYSMCAGSILGQFGQIDFWSFFDHFWSPICVVTLREGLKDFPFTIC